jgi:hypothetical protein
MTEKWPARSLYNAQKATDAGVAPDAFPAATACSAVFSGTRSGPASVCRDHTADETVCSGSTPSASHPRQTDRSLADLAGRSRADNSTPIDTVPRVVIRSASTVCGGISTCIILLTLPPEQIGLCPGCAAGGLRLRLREFLRRSGC